jgi:hypothetical protein
MKRAVITVLIFLSAAAVFDRGRSLPVMTEITLAEPVFVIAIDKDGDDVKLTLIYGKTEADDDGVINAKYVRSATASTAAAAA